MSLRFVGGEHLQRGRGIGGLLRLMKSVFSPVAKSVGKKVVSAIKSSSGKKILNVLKDQAIDSSMTLASNALKGNDMNTSIQDELNNVKSNLSTVIDELRENRKRSHENQSGSGIKKKQLKRNKRKPRRNYSSKEIDFFQ
jgi:hypothetical protein